MVYLQLSKTVFASDSKKFVTREKLFVTHSYEFASRKKILQLVRIYLQVEYSRVNLLNQ
jgi:hypothetical protein